MDAENVLSYPSNVHVTDVYLTGAREVLDGLNHVGQDTHELRRLSISFHYT